VRDRLKSAVYTTIQSLNHLRKGKHDVPAEAVVDYQRIQQLLRAN